MSTSSFTTYLPLAHRAILRPACANPQMDDFSDPQSGWPTGSLYGGVNIGYSEGKYYVEYSYPSYTDFRFSNGWQASDFYLDVEAQLINSENEGDEYGLIFGQNPDAFEFYVFSVEPQSGGYSLVRWAPDFDDVDTLVWGDSDAIRPGKSVNRLAVQRAGSQIKLWINGVLVAETSAFTLRDGMFLRCISITFIFVLIEEYTPFIRSSFSSLGISRKSSMMDADLTSGEKEDVWERSTYGTA